MAENLEMRESIARRRYGQIVPAGPYTWYIACPGKSLHTGKNGRRDCRLKLDGVPTLFCVHGSCAGAIEAENHALRAEIAAAEREGADRRPVRSGLEGCTPRPQAEPGPKIPPYSRDKLMLVASQCRQEMTPDWIAARSPVPVPSVAEQMEPGGGRATARLFIDTLYAPGERVEVFVRYFSQADFLAVSGGASYRLGDRPGVQAVKSELPSGGREGVWFLIPPVTGEWKPNTDPEPKMGRRHEACCTGFPFLLLESDTAPEGEWLKVLALLPLRIAALYTSGGQSVHALVRVDCNSKAEFDAARDVCRAVLCPLGADGAAMTAVRLSRLPGCMRFGKNTADGYKRYESPRLQRLLWLNPNPPENHCLLDIAK